MPNDVNGLGDKIVSSVRSFVARSLEALEVRIAAVEARPVHEHGEIDHFNLNKLHERVMAIEARVPEKGEKGADGINGKDGFDGAPGEPGMPGTDGKDGAPGADGRSLTVEEVRPMLLDMMESALELKFAGYVVEHERRLPEVLQRMIDKIEKPKDGINGRDGKDGRDGTDGKDGEDGFDLRHFDVTQTDERTVVFRLKDLTREKKHTLVFPVPIQRGIWNAEKPYARGDIVTWGGSQFEKLTDEPGGKPEEGTTWRMVVKRGRDGKDGVKGDRGEQGKAGRNGRDLTQMGSDGSKW